MPSNKAKQIWNAMHYTQVKVSVKPEIAKQFKVACVEAGVSMTAALSDFMAGYGKSNRPARACTQTTFTKDKFSTRKGRRTTVNAISARMEEVLAAEECYRENVPENLQGSHWHEASGESIALIQEIIGLLAEIY